MTLYWVRVRELRERYAIGWLAVATLLLLTGLFPEVLEGIADRAHLSYPALVLFVALGLIYLNSFFVSVALTKHYRWNVRLTQQMALPRRAPAAARGGEGRQAGGRGGDGGGLRAYGQSGACRARVAEARRGPTTLSGIRLNSGAPCLGPPSST